MHTFKSLSDNLVPVQPGTTTMECPPAVFRGVNVGTLLCDFSARNRFRSSGKSAASC